jgi:hypothetical protein
MANYGWTMPRLLLGVTSLTTVILFMPHGAGATGLTQGSRALKACELAASDGLATCFAAVSTRLRTCYLNTGQACLPDDVPLTRALNNLGRGASITRAVATLRFKRWATDRSPRQRRSPTQAAGTARPSAAKV